MHNFVFNFFFKFFHIYILKSFIILFNIINIVDKLRNIFGDWFDLTDWLNPLLYYLIIISNIEYISGL